MNMNMNKITNSPQKTIIAAVLAAICCTVSVSCTGGTAPAEITTPDPKLYGYEIVTSPTEAPFTIGQTAAVTEETEPITSVVAVDENGNPVISGDGFSIASETSASAYGDLGFISETAALTTEGIDFAVVTTPPLGDDVLNSEGMQALQKYSDDLAEILPQTDAIADAYLELITKYQSKDMAGVISSLEDQFLPLFQNIYDTISVIEIEEADIKPVHNLVVEAYRLIVRSYETMLQAVEEQNTNLLTESETIMEDAQRYLQEYQDGLYGLVTKYVAYS
jgi:hypothetical protein